MSAKLFYLLIAVAFATAISLHLRLRRRANRLPHPEYDPRSWHRIEQDQWKRGWR